MPTNVRQAMRSLPETNAAAYFAVASITKKKVLSDCHPLSITEQIQNISVGLSLTL